MVAHAVSRILGGLFNDDCGTSATIDKDEGFSHAGAELDAYFC